MDEEFEYFEGEDVLNISRRFRKADIIVLSLDLIAGVQKAIADTLMAARDVAAMHANWSADRDNFHEEAALEIETLISGDED